MIIYYEGALIPVDVDHTDVMYYYRRVGLDPNTVL